MIGAESFDRLRISGGDKVRMRGAVIARSRSDVAIPVEGEDAEIATLRSQ